MTTRSSLDPGGLSLSLPDAVDTPSPSMRGARPPALIYAVDERPPAAPLVLLGLQHMAIVASSLVVPVFVARAAGVDSATLAAIVFGIGLATFGVAAAVSVFGGPAFRLYAALIGMAAGVVLAASLGAIAPDGWRHLDAEPWLALPRLGHLAWTISPDPTLLLAFGLAAFAATLKTIGAVSTAQRLNDADWSRPDAGNLRRGVFGDGLASICAGLLGSTGQNSATSAVGISGATGATSRWIALTLAGWLAAMACMPKLAALFELMLGMVLGGVLAFAAIYMVANGIELIGSRVLDRRRALVVGAAIIAATSFRAMPELALALPVALQPFASSGLALGMVVAVVLNLVFRIGIHRRARLVVADLSQAEREIAAFLAVQAGLWGLRQELLARAVLALGHLLRCDGAAPQGHSRLTVEASYDELRLVLFLRRATTVPVLVPAERPSSPGRAMTLQVPGAELATMQRAVGSVCLRLELDA